MCIRDRCLLTPQAQSTLLFLACSTDSGFETVDSLTLPHGIVSFDSILAGRTANGQTALFLDSTVDLYDTSFQITDVVSARQREDGSPALVNLLDNENLSLSKMCIRDSYELDQNLAQADLCLRNSFMETGKARQAFDYRLLVMNGIEMGQAIQNKEKAQEILRRYRFDFVLGSLHCLSLIHICF